MSKAVKNGGYVLSDLHCHILPGVDDGAKNIEESQALLASEHAQGIRQIMFTPHFYPSKMDMQHFLQRRYNAFEQIYQLCGAYHIDCGIGAEVHMDIRLRDMDLRAFALGDTPYLLLEWPFSSYPLWGNDVVKAALSQGLRPVFAHIERYEYLWNEPEELEHYIKNGVLCQVNADTILSKRTQKQAMRLIKQGYVHFLSSDAHNMRSRTPKLEQAFEKIEKHLGSSACERLITNADSVFHGRSVAIGKPIKEKSSLLKRLLG